MLQLRNTASEVRAFSEDFIASGVKGVVMPELVLPFVNGGLQLQSKFGFFPLDDQVGQHTAQERGGYLAAHVPAKLIAPCWGSHAVTVDVQRASVGSLQSLNDGQVGHTYPPEQLVSDVHAVGLRPFGDTDEPFAVEQTGGVSVIEQDDLSLSFGWDVGEFGGSPMPGPKGCGRVTPSQAGGPDRLLGVCNEQGPTAKAKACSELHGNMQRSAEMTGPATSCNQPITDYTSQVTDCDTDYIYWQPHRDRNMVPLDKVNSLNQDATVQLIIFMGNMTVSNAELQGVLWST